MEKMQWEIDAKTGVVYHRQGPLGRLAVCSMETSQRKYESMVVAAPGMYEALDATAVDLDYLRRAIEAGDPKPELLIRIKDIQDRNAAALSKAEGGEGQG